VGFDSVVGDGPGAAMNEKYGLIGHANRSSYMGSSDGLSSRGDGCLDYLHIDCVDSLGIDVFHCVPITRRAPMRWLDTLRLRLRGLLFHQRESQRLRVEMQFHLDGLIAENVAGGMSPEEARYAAMRAFGNATGRERADAGSMGLDVAGAASAGCSLCYSADRTRARLCADCDPYARTLRFSR
jgi:hypothetical protein